MSAPEPSDSRLSGLDAASILGAAVLVVALLADGPAKFGDSAGKEFIVVSIVALLSMALGWGLGISSCFQNEVTGRQRLACFSLLNASAWLILPVTSSGPNLVPAVLYCGLFLILRLAGQVALDLFRRPIATEYVLIAGTERSSMKLAREIERSTKGRVQVVGALGKNFRLRRWGRLRTPPVLGTMDDIPRVAEELRVRGIEISRIVAPRDLKPEFVHALTYTCSELRLEIEHVDAAEATSMVPAGGYKLLTYETVKRSVDFTVSVCSLLLLAPLLAGITAIIFVRLGSPVLFSQRRVGRFGKPFFVYKFKSLRDLYDKRGVRRSNVQRIEAFGTFLRYSHLDELPQLINVLRGEMSLIGPRPLLPTDQPASSNRLVMRPGITGLAQVQGGQRLSNEEKAYWDERYVEGACFSLDLKIASATVELLLHGGCKDEWVSDAALRAPAVNAVPVPRREADFHSDGR